MNPPYSAWHVRLKQERERLWPLMQGEAADAMQIGRSMLSRYETGGTAPGLEVLQKMHARGIDTHYVLTGERRTAAVAPPVSPDTTHLSATEPRGSWSLPSGAQSQAAPAVPGRQPLLLSAMTGGVRREYKVLEKISERVCAGRDAAGGVGGGAAGGQVPPLQLDPAGVLAMERGFMRAALGGDGDSFMSVLVEGDSMSPALANGDLIVIDSAVTRINVSGIYVLRFDGELTVKRVIRKSDGSVLVTSDNPAYAKADEHFTREAAAAINVIGRMVWPRVR